MFMFHCGSHATAHKSMNMVITFMDMMYDDVGDML